MGSARPLDFGHWVAHKLEQVTEFEVNHGEAVAIGMAVDILYASRAGILDPASADRILRLIGDIGFETWHPGLCKPGHTGEPAIMEGLEEFREHLGGKLTITLVPEIGKKIEVHTMEREHILAAIADLEERSKPQAAAAVG